ncbi:Hypothetical predicted protein [Pelobates cultripes]|uniref:Uncharacterized protein n=1 Tax=Pelobates cultripes TaxID=61616 RepID=A0AAD1R5K3_PELCU|nr:Hypothetical predicted protein [Pelobates cultripes]
MEQAIFRKRSQQGSEDSNYPEVFWSSEPGYICDSSEEQSPFSLSSSSSCSSLFNPISDETIQDPDLPLQKLNYTKSMILSHSRGPRGFHRRNLSHHEFQTYGNSDPSTDVPRIPLVTVLDVPHVGFINIC